MKRESNFESNEIDDIINAYGGESVTNPDDINIDSILKENTSVSPNKSGSGFTSNNNNYSFKPTLNNAPDSTTTNDYQSYSNDEVDKILRDHDKLYNSNDLMTVDPDEVIKKILEGSDSTLLSNSILDGSQSARKRKSIKKDIYANFKDAIECINYLETEFNKKSLENNADVFALKIYKEKAKIKFIVLDFEKKKTLSATRLFKNNNLVTSITASKDLLFAGNNLGTIRMYSIEKEYEYKAYTNKDIEQLADKRSVVCMDVSADGDYLIAGYSNGYLALWDLHTTKCRKLVTGVFKSCIVACKFIRSDKKKWEMLVSEMNGNCYKATIKDGIFSTSIDTQILMKNVSPFFLINILNYEDEFKNCFPELKKCLIVSLGCLEFVTILLIEPSCEKLFQIDRPKTFRDSYVPDISFGVGLIPTPPEHYNIESDTNSEDIAQSSIDYQKPQTLLSVSWGKYIFVYSINVFNSRFYINIAGHYINTTPILRMGFISNSIIFFFDKDKLVKVINSSLIPPGDVRFNDSYNASDTPLEINQTGYSPELEEGNIIDPDLQFQTYVVDKIENCNKATYNNFIVSMDKSIYLLARKDFYHGKLLNWEQCLNNLNQKSEWMDALTLGLDIYHGRTTALADIPMDTYVRKTKVGHVLRNMIHHYVIIHAGNENNIRILSTDKSFNERMIKCINICIEFCIDIGSVDFLLNNLQAIFDGKGQGNLFIEKLEPFILCDKIIHEELQQTTISKIIELYISKKKFHVLSQILVHLDIKSLDIDSVRDYCNQYSLITPLIYVYTNSTLEDYFYPVTKIYEIFLKAPVYKGYTSFRELYKDLTPEIEMSKEFIGHKLLWYIHLCLCGKKFPRDNIPEHKFGILVIQILNWLLNEQIFISLLEFDSLALFKILMKFFEDEKLITLLPKGENLNLVKYGIYITDFKPSTLLDFYVTKAKNSNNKVIQQNIYELIAKCSCIIEVSKNLIVETGKFLLKPNNPSMQLTLTPLSGDDSSINFDKIEHISNITIDMIESRKDLDMSDLGNLLHEADVSPFILVKIHLLKKVKNYARCLNEFFQNDSYLKKKENLIFAWIDDTLRELNDEDVYNFDKLKEEVLNKLPDLADISIDNVTKLVENWFNNDQRKVILKLDKVKELQLKYVESVLDKHRDNIELYMTHDGMGIDSDDKFEQYSSILTLHIKLLCKLKNKSKEVLSNLKKRSFYPIDDCLRMCLKYKVHDGAIYLMQTTGATKDAVNLSIQIIEENFKKIVENLTSSGFKENIHYMDVEELHKSLNQSVQICEKNSDRASGDDEEYWFMILEQLYSINQELIDNCISSRRAYFDDLIKKISHEIRELLEKMCSYVSIQKIITNVTEKYKSAEFKEFKKILLNMLSSYSHLKNILYSAKNLLANSILYNVIELKKLNSEGNRYNLYRCDGCSRIFNHLSDESICVFGCGHKYHIPCAEIKGEMVCHICKKNEIENSVTNPNIKIRPSLIEKDFPQFDESYGIGRRGSLTQNENINQKASKFDMQFNRLKALDDHYLEKSSLLFG